MKVTNNHNNKEFTDHEILDIIKYDSNIISILFNRHKTYSINFMKNMYQDYEEIKDIFQDAIIVFYENALKQDFKLTCTIQTYLNSICRNQILKRIKESNRHPLRNIDDDSDYVEGITDWFDEIAAVNNERINIMQSILIEMKTNSSKCYDILVRFFYKNQTMEKIAVEMDYTNADNAKNQKYRCQEKLKKEVFNRLNRA